MNILLWALQVVIAFFCFSGAGWRFANYEQAAKDVPSMAALSHGMWNAIGIFEIICAVCLIIPGAFNFKPMITPVAAALLAVELLLISGLHIKYFGFQMTATNPAVWSGMLCILSAVVAFGRFFIKPL